MSDQPLTDDEQAARRAAVAKIMPDTPYLKWLGIEFTSYEPDAVSARLPFKADLTNDGTHYHGGVTAAVIDTTGAAAAWSGHDFNKGVRAATVGMSINYVGSCKGSDMLCRARVISRRKDLIFTEITATDAAGATVAHGIQTYRIA